jgi:pimeloyl-ACP methyl ester carboxylesterase
VGDRAPDRLKGDNDMTDVFDGAGARPWVALGPVDAPAIVFLHGTRLTRAQWFPQLRRLAGRYRCVAVDLPGHGRRGEEQFTIEGAVAAVDEAIAAEVPSGRAVLVGLSLGGYVAIETAAALPDRVAGLVLAGCSAEALGPTAWPFGALAIGLGRLPRGVSDGLNRAFFSIRYRRSIAAPIIEAGFWPDGGAQAVRLIIGRRFLERLGRLWTPVLIVNGSLDPVFGPQGDYWAASCRAGRSVTLPHATHLSSIDRPRAFSTVVAAFTDRVARGG